MILIRGLASMFPRRRHGLLRSFAVDASCRRNWRSVPLMAPREVWANPAEIEGVEEDVRSLRRGENLTAATI